MVTFGLLDKKKSLYILFNEALFSEDREKSCERCDNLLLRCKIDFPVFLRNCYILYVYHQYIQIKYPKERGIDLFCTKPVVIYKYNI